MSEVIERIEQTREALLAALAGRDWDAVGELDLECRLCVEDVLAEASQNEGAVRASLEQLLEKFGGRRTVRDLHGRLGRSVLDLRRRA
ncbi:MAG: hypothetical protein ACLGJA_24600, partial [Gammaproteobacteria bacterium]